MGSASAHCNESLCSFGDYQLLCGREIGKAELENLADHVQRQWHGFTELQSIARIVEAHRKVIAATSRGSPAPPEAVHAVLREAETLQWLPRSPEQVAVCTRRAKSMLQPYQRDLLPATLVAVASALAGDAKSKQDPRLAQVRLHAIPVLLLPQCMLLMMYPGCECNRWCTENGPCLCQVYRTRDSCEFDLCLSHGDDWCRKRGSRRHCWRSLPTCSTASKVRTLCHKLW